MSIPSNNPEAAKNASNYQSTSREVSQSSMRREIDEALQLLTELHLLEASDLTPLRSFRGLRHLRILDPTRVRPVTDEALGKVEKDTSSHH